MQLRKSRTSVIIFKILVYVHASMKGSMFHPTAPRVSTFSNPAPKSAKNTKLLLFEMVIWRREFLLLISAHGTKRRHPPKLFKVSFLFGENIALSPNLMAQILSKTFDEDSEYVLNSKITFTAPSTLFIKIFTRNEVW